MTFQRYAAAGAAAILTLCGAEGAAAASLDHEFERVCMPASSGDQAVANARAAAFVTAPDDIKRKLAGFPKDGVILWRTVEGEITLFISAKQYQRAGGPFTQPLMAEMCAVASMPAQTGVADRLEQVLNVGEEQTLNRAVTFLYTQTAAGRSRVDANSRNLTDLALAGNLRMTTVRTARDQSMVMQITPRQPTDVERKLR